MCGILGVVAKTPVNQLLYDGLLLLQHRGPGRSRDRHVGTQGVSHAQRARNGAATYFRTRNMRSLSGAPASGTAAIHRGLGVHAGEAQPFYVNSPFGIVLGHNGNLTNSEVLKQEMFRQDLRHINTNSDSEVLLNVLAHELELAQRVRSSTRNHLYRSGERAPALPRRYAVWP